MNFKHNLIHITLSAAMVVAPAVVFGLVTFGTAHAAAPMVKTSAPGFFRMMLGDFEVTALSDGTVSLPVDKLLTNTTPAKVKKALDKAFVAAPLETSVNGYLINTGTKLVLIDTGAATLFGPTLGNLLANLKAAGYKPEQFDEVRATPMHPDPVGCLMDGDMLAFPNATVCADRPDADLRPSQINLKKTPAGAKSFFQGAMASFEDAPSNLLPHGAASRCLSYDETYSGVFPRGTVSCPDCLD